MFERRRPDAGDAPAAQAAWSSTGLANWPLRLTVGNARQEAVVAVTGADHYLVALGDRTIEVSIEERLVGAVRFTESGVQRTARFAWHEGMLYLDLNGLIAAAHETAPEASAAKHADRAPRLLAPMNGAIVAVDVKAGDRVVRGQRLVVLEAMKMQHEIRAQRDGIIGSVLVETGHQVVARQLLVELEPEATARPRNPPRS